MQSNFSSFNDFSRVHGGTFKAPTLTAKKWHAIEKMLKHSLIVKLGTGEKVSFWKDIWIDDQPLQPRKERFLRLFLISIQKDCLLNDMGFWNANCCEWILRWRRNLFQWESQ